MAPNDRPRSSPTRSPPSHKPRKRPKNREVENEMMGWQGETGEPPHSATEPLTPRHDKPEVEDLRAQEDKHGGDGTA